MRQLMCVFILLMAVQAGLWSQSRIDSSSVPVAKAEIPLDIRAAIEQSAQGSVDPFEVLPKVIARGDSAVKVLSEILNANGSALTLSAEMRIDGATRRARTFAMQCLEGIGTAAAYDVVFAVASAQGDRELQGLALRALALGFHRSSYPDIAKPDKELLHFLFRNVDDTTHVAQLDASVGEVARHGIVNWFGQDPGEPQGNGHMVKEGTKYNTVGASARRELWWKQYSDRIRWNAQQRIFEVR